MGGGEKKKGRKRFLAAVARWRGLRGRGARGPARGSWRAGGREVEGLRLAAGGRSAPSPPALPFRLPSCRRSLLLCPLSPWPPCGPYRLYTLCVPGRGHRAAGSRRTVIPAGLRAQATQAWVGSLFPSLHLPRDALSDVSLLGEPAPSELV